MVIFMVATMLLLTTTAALRIDTEGRRDREAELVWRGEQYKSAIRMYFRKFGHPPTKVDDLVKLTNGVRFLRQAYTDPMNKDDGSWRFIYLGPGGQLIGSLRHTSLLQLVAGAPPIPGTAPASGSAANSIGVAGTTGQTGQQSTSLFDSQPQSLQGPVIGGNIIGVASKVKDASIRVYDGGDTYEMWEFIGNPQQQFGVPGQGVPTGPTTAPGVPMPGQSNPAGSGLPPAPEIPPTGPAQPGNPTGQ
jgi:hypothetical protein